MTSPFINFSDGINGDRYDTKYQVEDGKIVGRTMSIKRAIWRGGCKVRRLPFMRQGVLSKLDPVEMAFYTHDGVTETYWSGAFTAHGGVSRSNGLGVPAGYTRVGLKIHEAKGVTDPGRLVPDLKKRQRFSATPWRNQ
jgi:hypothetical protein